MFIKKFELQTKKNLKYKNKYMKYINPQNKIISKFVLQCGEAEISANKKKKTTKFLKG